MACKIDRSLAVRQDWVYPDAIAILDLEGGDGITIRLRAFLSLED